MSFQLLLFLSLLFVAVINPVKFKILCIYNVYKSITIICITLMRLATNNNTIQKHKWKPQLYLSFRNRLIVLQQSANPSINIVCITVVQVMPLECILFQKLFNLLFILAGNSKHIAS